MTRKLIEKDCLRVEKLLWKYISSTTSLEEFTLVIRDEFHFCQNTNMLWLHILFRTHFMRWIFLTLNSRDSEQNWLQIDGNKKGTFSSCKPPSNNTLFYANHDKCGKYFLAIRQFNPHICRKFAEKKAQIMFSFRVS